MTSKQAKKKQQQKKEKGNRESEEKDTQKPQGLFSRFLQTKPGMLYTKSQKTDSAQSVDGASSPTPSSPADSAVAGALSSPAKPSQQTELPDGFTELPSALTSHEVLASTDLIPELLTNVTQGSPTLPAPSAPPIWLPLSRALTASILDRYMDKDLALNDPFATLSSTDIQNKIDSNNVTLAAVQAQIATMVEQFSVVELNDVDAEREKEGREDRDLEDRVIRIAVSEVLREEMGEVLEMVGVDARWIGVLRGEVWRWVKDYRLPTDEEREVGPGAEEPEAEDKVGPCEPGKGEKRMWSRDDVQGLVEDWFGHLEKVSVLLWRVRRGLNKGQINAGVRRAESNGSKEIVAEQDYSPGCLANGVKEAEQEQMAGESTSKIMTESQSVMGTENDDQNNKEVQPMSDEDERMAVNAGFQGHSHSFDKGQATFSLRACRSLESFNNQNLNVKTKESGHRSTKSWSR
ncbi:Hypothetical protein D9617_24g016710 [Elsinoe fawcettii]|nr:Hypothetical protein D9617_24g016710 [Elsinoe fawcettii]